MKLNTRLYALSLVIGLSDSTVVAQDGAVTGNKSSVKSDIAADTRSRIEEAAALGTTKYTTDTLERLGKLLNHPDVNVRVTALQSVCDIASDAKLPVSQADELAHRFRTRISPERIEAARNRDFNDNESWELAWRILAADSLYLWYPLVSVIDYNIWQEEIIKPMFQSLASRRDTLSVGTDNAMLALFGAVYTPSAISEITPSLVNNLANEIEDTSSERFAQTIFVCWKHRLVGKGGAMHNVLKSAVRPHLGLFQNKVKEIENKYQREEVSRILAVIRNDQT